MGTATRRSYGVSLIEFLIVIAVIGILASLIGPNLFALRPASIVQQASQEVAREIERARIEARRLNTTASVTMTVGESSFLVVVGSSAERTVNLPANVEFVAVPVSGGAIEFIAPYGAVSNPGVHTIRLAWARPGSTAEREVRVVGVMGKVVTR